MQADGSIESFNTMFKKTFLFITTLLTATSTSTGYGAPDALKGTINSTIFLDWFNHAEKYVHIKGLIILDLIPALFLIIQATLFFKDGMKIKGVFTVLALLANLIGVLFITQYANPIAAQIAGWTPASLPADWSSLKDDWLKYIGYYGVLGILGWLCFVITYFVPAKRNTSVKQLPRGLNFTKNALIFLLTFVAGQSAARLYDFSFFPFQYEISGTTLIEMHRPLDMAIRIVGPILFTVLFAFYLLLITILFIEKSKRTGWLIVAALITLLCDTFIALQFNRPINDLFLTWTPTTIPANWKSVRDEWLNYHFYRDVFMLLGFISILLCQFINRTKLLLVTN